MRRFVALLQGLPAATARVWATERATPREPVKPPLRKVTPLEAMQMLRGGPDA